jgi:hypothetical protein
MRNKDGPPPPTRRGTHTKLTQPHPYPADFQQNDTTAPSSDYGKAGRWLETATGALDEG